MNLSALVALFLFMLASVMALSADFEREQLVIHKRDGTTVRLNVELAVAAHQRQQGLMNRDEMPADHGMLFDFGETRRVYMWMKNTYLPLDMLFIRADGTIAAIRADTMPLSEEVIDSKEPVRFVLELNAGSSSRLGIQPGDRAESPRIAAASTNP